MSGTFWGPKLKKGGKKGSKVARYFFVLEVLLALFWCFLEYVFSCVFQWAFFLHFGPIWSPKVPKREVLGGHFDDILGAGATCAKRCFM